MINLFLLFILLSPFTFASDQECNKFISPLYPSYKLRQQFTTPNTHVVLNKFLKPKVYRSMAPRNKCGGSDEFLPKLQEFKKAGVTDVLIFKNFDPEDRDNGEYKTETKLLTNIKINYKHIPFRWKNFESFQTTCMQTLNALKYVFDVYNDKSRKLLIHCTVGEDRTGYLAGLLKMLKLGWKLPKAFDQELCDKGYAHGNPHKPFARVICPLRKELTPLFLKMAYFIETQQLRWEDLAFPEKFKSICQRDPAENSSFQKNIRYSAKEYTCRPSKRKQYRKEYQEPVYLNGSCEVP